MSLTELIHFDKEGKVVRNSLFKRLFLSLVILLVAILSFGVGRLTATPGGRGIKIEYDPSLSAFRSSSTPLSKSQTATPINAFSPSDSPIGVVVGSKNGSKYHYPHCAGAKQIKEENKISFNSPQEAEASGYTLAGNCRPR